MTQKAIGLGTKPPSIRPPTKKQIKAEERKKGFPLKSAKLAKGKK